MTEPGFHGRFRAVSFDVGETLVRPYPTFAVAFARLCGAAGVSLAGEQAARIEPLLAERLMDYQRCGLTFSDSVDSSRAFWTSLYRDCLHDLGVEEPALGRLPEVLYDGFTRTENYGLFDDAREVIVELRRRGFLVGVLSNWESWLVRMLADLELDRLLDFAVISGVLGIEKPDPRIYAAAIGAAKVGPAEILHVGDSYVTDVVGPRAAGMSAVLLDRFERHGGADCPRVSRLSDLLDATTPAGSLLAFPLGSPRQEVGD